MDEIRRQTSQETKLSALSLPEIRRAVKASAVELERELLGDSEAIKWGNLLNYIVLEFCLSPYEERLRRSKIGERVLAYLKSTDEPVNLVGLSGADIDNLMALSGIDSRSESDTKSHTKTSQGRRIDPPGSKSKKA